MRLDFENVNLNGRSRKSRVVVLDDDGKEITTDEENVVSLDGRQKLAARLAKRLNRNKADIEKAVEEAYTRALQQARSQPREESPPTVELLLQPPETIRRPLCIVGQHAYAAAWVHVSVTETLATDPKTGEVTLYNPPRVRTEPVLVVVRDDGTAFGAGAALPPGVRPAEELGVQVRLPMEPHPARTWSGAGVQRYLDGVRPPPAEVFRQVAEVVGRFMDFKRSFAPQEVMCELISC